MSKKREIFARISEQALSRPACVLLVLFFLSANLLAERLPVHIFTSADGLGSSFVSYLMRDSHGFLWFCTRDGLSRYDGFRFITYQVGGKNSPPGIEQIVETRDGVYWIATTGGLYRFDPNKFVENQTQSSDRPMLNAEFVSDQRGFLYEDRDGNLWVGAAGLFHLSEADGKVSLQSAELALPVNPSIQFNIAAIYEASDASLWLITTWGVVRRLPDGREIYYSINDPRKDPLNGIVEDRAGRIWIGSASGIFVIDPEAIDELPQSATVALRNLDELARTQPKEQVRMPGKSGEIFKFTAIEGFNESNGKFLSQTSDEHIWISSGTGIVEFDGQSFIPHTTAEGLPQSIGMMTEDISGNLWCSSATGLMRLDRQGFTSYTAADGLRNPSVLTIAESRDGKFYLGASDFYISEFGEKGLQTVRPPIPPNARALWSSNPIFRDSRGEWWILTNEKLYRFPAVKNLDDLARAAPLATYDSRSGLKGDLIFHIFEDSAGDLWVSNRSAGSDQFGLARWDHRAEKFYSFSEAEGFPSNKSVSSFVEDRSGNLWLGFYEGGLVRFTGGRFTEFAPVEDTTSGVVTALHLDRQGRLWIASSLSGLSRIADLTAPELSFVRYTVENGLSSNNVRSLTEDDFGNIYAGTARGVDRVSPETGHIKHYSTSDGLAGDFVAAAFRTEDGALWFGTPGGLSRIVPEKEQTSKAPPVLLSNLRIAGENRPISELGAAEISNLELAPSQNNLQIDFFGIDFNPNEALRYQYMLEGADADWSAPTEQRAVNYSNLSSGNYRFLVRAVNADGVRSEQPAVFSFKLLPPVYRRWWFIAGVILITSAGVFALDRFRVKKTRQVKAALNLSQESETRYRTLAETASDAIITIDETSRIVYVNDAIEKIFGYTARELIGANLTILMPEKLRPQHDAGINRYLTSNQKRISWEAVELPGEHKDGSAIPLELSFGTFEQDGRKFFTGIARDVSERKKAEAALQKAREERLAELERVRLRIARDLHDDVGSSLTQIALFSEVAKQKQNGNAEAARPLEFLVETSNELVEAMSDIVWAINPNKDHLLDLTQRMRRFASESLTNAGIDLEFHVPESDTEMGANLRREVFLIFKESVNNIVKHSQASAAKIDFELENNVLTLRLEDDGGGFDLPAEAAESSASLAAHFSESYGGNGLASMRRRAAELGGAYSIDSAPGRGTIIILRVPL
jgi:PAS domain S-box-containing protein